MARATSLEEDAERAVVSERAAFVASDETARETARGGTATRQRESERAEKVSGFRADARVAVWVDVARGIREGVPFFLSANDVVLSPGEGDTGAIPPRLFLRATDLKTGEALAL